MSEALNLKEEIKILKGEDFGILLKIKVAADTYNPAKIKSGEAAAEYEQALAKGLKLDEASNQYRKALKAEKETINSILETPILTFFKPQKLQQELQSEKTADQSLATASIALIKKLSDTGHAMQGIEERHLTQPLNETSNSSPTLFSHQESTLHKEDLDQQKRERELDKAGKPKPEHKSPR